MASPVSIGDVVMLSSLAWKIGSAFTSGRAGAPAELQEVENELRSLKISLGVLQDTLNGDHSILSRADRRTNEGLGTILASCSQTLKNLETLVDRYQDVRKTEGGPGAAAPRVWRGSVVRNYKKFLWTSEGGNIQTLRNMLHMHVGSINIMISALHSQSSARLENAIHPMADKTDGIHNTVVGSMDVKIAEMHNLIMAMSSTGTSPLLRPLSRSHTLISEADTLVTEQNTDTPSAMVSNRDSPKLNSISSVAGRESSPQHDENLGLQKHRHTSSRSSSRSNFPKSGTSSPLSTSYETPPMVFADSELASDQHQSSQSLQKAIAIPALELPQPALRTTDLGSQLALPSASLVPTHSSQYSGFVFFPNEMEAVEDRQPASKALTASQQEAFEHAVLDNAVTLCKGVGISVDYIQRNHSDESSEQQTSKVVQVMKDCTISIVTKMRSNSVGRTRHVTSVWAMSDDRTVRLQQQLEDDAEIIPYTVWGKTTSVVLRVPTELRYHDIDLYDKPLSTAKTSWVNYHFLDEHGSKTFQSALMWKRLLYSFRTRRTMLSHEGFVMSTFSFQEQLCGLENLRLWRDDEAGSTIAMIQYSPSFHEGYFSFRLSGPGTMAKAVDDGEKWVKIKGLNIVLEPKSVSVSSSSNPSSPDGSSRSKKSEAKNIRAIRVEFSSSEEKYKFLEVCGRAK